LDQRVWKQQSASWNWSRIFFQHIGNWIDKNKLGRMLFATGDAPAGHKRNGPNFNPDVTVAAVDSHGNSIGPCFIVELETHHRDPLGMRWDFACYFDSRRTIQGVLGIKVFEHTAKNQWEAAAVLWVRSHSESLNENENEDLISIGFAYDFGPSSLSENHMNQFSVSTTSMREGLRSANVGAAEEGAPQCLPPVELEHWRRIPWTQSSECMVSIPAETILRNILNTDEYTQVPALQLDLHELIFQMQLSSSLQAE
jgi:hypothetical protein